MLSSIDTFGQRGLRARIVRGLGGMMHRRTLVRTEVRPLDDAEALSGEPDPFRVVLAGSGITSGWGVSTHGLALTGATQRSLQRSLGRPVDVVQVSRVGGVLADAVDVLATRLDGSVDCVVLAFGWSDAFSLTPVARWTETLDGVLDLLARRARGPLPVVVVGLPPMDRLGITSLLGPLVRRHGERLNAASRAVIAARGDAVFADLAAPANTVRRPWGSPEAYHAWSLPIAAAIGAATAQRDRLSPSAAVGRSVDAAGIGADLYREAAIVPLPESLRAAVRRSIGGVPDVPRRRAGEVADAIRMRTGVRQYAMRVLEELGHPPLSTATGAPCRTLVIGPHPIRVLFFGAGLAVGYGVETRADAVDGPFAHGLSDALGRGVVLENRAEKHLRLDQATASLGGVGTFSYDLAVWFPSFSDGMDRLRPAWWRNRLHAMIRELRADDRVPLLLTHMPVPAGLHPAALIARPWVRRLNRVIDQVAMEWDDVRAAATEPFFPAEIGQKVTDRAYFRAVSDHILPTAEALLVTGRGEALRGDDPGRGPGSAPLT